MWSLKQDVDALKRAVLMLMCILKQHIQISRWKTILDNAVIVTASISLYSWNTVETQLNRKCAKGLQCMSQGLNQVNLQESAKNKIHALKQGT